MNCSHCGKSFELKQGALASISGSIMGDETTETWFFCEPCQVYTVEVCHDRFCGETSVTVKGPIAKADGDEQVALIHQCDTPWDKKCRCSAHVDYFEGWLD